MHSLLQLPCETRLTIFGFAVRMPSSPPKCPTVSQKGRQRVSTAGSKSIWNLSPANPALSLLLVNRQIHGEVQDVLRRSPTDYAVDIMYVKNYGLWATWLSFPRLPPTQYIDSIRATMRIFEPTQDIDPLYQRSLCFEGYQGAWAMYGLLDALFTRGPGFNMPYGNGTRKAYIVKNIVVDVLAPTDGAAHTSTMLQDSEARQVHQWWWHFGPHDSSIIAPEERLARYVICLSQDTTQFCYLTSYKFHGSRIPISPTATIQRNGLRDGCLRAHT